MENKNKWPVENYAKLHNNNWIETVFEKGQCCLIMKASQLYVINKDIAIESVCLLGGAGGVKCFFANQSLGISVSKKQNIMTKFRIRFASAFGKSSEDCCVEVAEQLKKFIIVTEHPSHKGRKPKEYVTSKPLNEMVKDLLNSERNLLNNFELDIPDDILKETIQQCVLDPGFPSLVGKVESILNTKYEE